MTRILAARVMLTILKEAFLLIITKYSLLICLLDGENHFKDLNKFKFFHTKSKNHNGKGSIMLCSFSGDCYILIQHVHVYIPNFKFGKDLRRRHMTHDGRLTTIAMGNVSDLRDLKSEIRWLLKCLIKSTIVLVPFTCVYCFKWLEEEKTEEVGIEEGVKALNGPLSCILK